MKKMKIQWTCLVCLLLGGGLAQGDEPSQRQEPKSKGEVFLNKEVVWEDQVRELTLTAEKPTIPTTMKMIIGDDPTNQGFRERLKKVHELGPYLSPSEIKALLWYLHKSNCYNALVRNCSIAEEGKCSNPQLELSQKSKTEKGENCSSTLGRESAIKEDKSNPLLDKSKQYHCELDLLQTNVLKNDIAVALLTQHGTVQEFPEHLMAMFLLKKCSVGNNGSSALVREGSKEKDKAGVIEKKLTDYATDIMESATLSEDQWYHDQVWRDYCIQFLGQWLEKYPSSARKSEILKTLLLAMQEKNSSVGGTALISIYNNKEKLTPVEFKLLTSQALVLAIGPDVVDSSKITAYQICAMTGVKEVLPTIRKEAVDGSNASLRMSAIAALGFIGETQDSALLEKVSNSYDSRIRKAAFAAIQRLRK